MGGLLREDAEGRLRRRRAAEGVLRGRRRKTSWVLAGLRGSRRKTSRRGYNARTPKENLRGGTANGARSYSEKPPKGTYTGKPPTEHYDEELPKETWKEECDATLPKEDATLEF